MSSVSMAKSRPSTADTSFAVGLTRYQVARQLGVGITTVLRMCQRGELHPRRGVGGVWRYDPAEVVRLQAMRMDPGRRTAGQTAAAAFHMFDTGVEFKDVVILLQLAPGDVRRLYREWQSDFDAPPELERDRDGVALLDEDPRAEEAFQRAMAEAVATADSSALLAATKSKRQKKDRGAP